MSERRVNKEGPQDYKNDPCPEIKPFNKGSRYERDGDDGEHHLESGKYISGTVPETLSRVMPEKKNLSMLADNSADVFAERQAVLAYHPEGADYNSRGKL